jgi:hypothetical protein
MVNDMKVEKKCEYKIELDESEYNELKDVLLYVANGPFKGNINLDKAMAAYATRFLQVLEPGIPVVKDGN